MLKNHRHTRVSFGEMVARSWRDVKYYVTNVKIILNIQAVCEGSTSRQSTKWTSTSVTVVKQNSILAMDCLIMRDHINT